MSVMVMLSVLVGWFPGIGTLVAGSIGGRVASGFTAAFLASLLPGLLMGILLFFLATLLSCMPLIGVRSEEHTSELQSLMRISYAVFCMKKKNIITQCQLTPSINTYNRHIYYTHHTSTLTNTTSLHL